MGGYQCQRVMAFLAFFLDPLLLDWIPFFELDLDWVSPFGGRLECSGFVRVWIGGFTSASNIDFRYGGGRGPPKFVDQWTQQRRLYLESV